MVCASLISRKLINEKLVRDAHEQDTRLLPLWVSISDYCLLQLLPASLFCLQHCPYSAFSSQLYCTSTGLPSLCLNLGLATQCICLLLSRSHLHGNESSMKARALHVVLSVPSPVPVTGLDIVEALINIYGAIKYQLIDFWDCSFFF